MCIAFTRKDLFRMCPCLVGIMHTHSTTIFPQPFRIPTSSSSKLSLGALRRVDTSADMSLSREDLQSTCCILCTADYCLDTSQQLQTKLKEKISPLLREKIDLSQEEECFRKLVSVMVCLKGCQPLGFFGSDDLINPDPDPDLCLNPVD